jgi:hypothetical protein
MNKYTNPKYIVEVDNAKEGLLEVANILKRLRETTKFWEEHFGAHAKVAKKTWEASADKWLAEHIKVEESLPEKNDWEYSNKNFQK